MKIIIILLILSGAYANTATLTHAYDFNGSLADTYGGPSLVSYGGTIAGGRYVFGAQQGLKLSNAQVDPANYSIEMIFNFSDILYSYNDWKSIINFRDGTEEALYGNAVNGVVFWPIMGGPAGILVNNQDIHLVVTRNSSSNLFTAYVNGVEQFNMTESTYTVFNTANKILWFFLDNGSEYAPGSVDMIRIYNGALSSSEVASLSNVPEPGYYFLLTLASIFLYQYKQVLRILVK